jgi:hypothetical protein
VKTGRQAPRLGHADTRRQMLEYQLAFEVPGVLLVDAESGRVREVRFPVTAGAVLQTSSARRGLGWFAVITLMLVAALIRLLGRP